jgi:hypothetical protein
VRGGKIAGGIYGRKREEMNGDCQEKGLEKIEIINK